MTQRERAYKLGISREYLSRIESGKYPISKRMSKKLNVGYKGVPQNASPVKISQRDGVNTPSPKGQNGRLGLCRLSLEGRCGIVCQNPTTYPCYRPWRLNDITG